MKRPILIFLLGLLIPGRIFAQTMFAANEAVIWPPSRGVSPPFPLILADTPAIPALASKFQLPVMAPDLTLSTYQQHVAQQAKDLAGYSAVTVVRAELPETSQQGEYEVQRKFEAPHSLQFTPVHFSGDGFVKSNVINRVLQSEVDHVQKDDPELTAISPANYKFSYKGMSHVGDRLVHEYLVKPRKKRMGLFKGHVFLDAHTGTLVRAEGAVVRSPSFFVKHIEFVQDYTEVQSFTLPVHIHSEAKARIVGRTIVDIQHRDYQAVPAGSAASVARVPSSESSSAAKAAY